MITFNYETDFIISDASKLQSWIHNVITKHHLEEGDINFVFCDDNYLHKLNVQFLQHDTLTDVISFDNSLGSLINGDIYISIERVQENALDYKVSFEEELHRVMIHGVLHFIGFKDKTTLEQEVMTIEENKALSYLSA